MTGRKGETTPARKRVFDRRVLYPGDVLIREKDYGDSAYYIQNGQVGVYKRVGEDEVLITVLPGNSIVGEMALIDDGRRSPTVRCLETATVVVINRDTFERKLGRLDPFVRALLEMFSQKLRRLNDDYCDAERKLQWLLRQTGLPPQQSGSRWRRDRVPPTLAKTPPPKPQSLPSSLEAEVEAALPELSPEAIDRFDRLKIELALLYHPDCTGHRTDEPLKRGDVFREVWAILQKIEEEYRATP